MMVMAVNPQVRAGTGSTPAKTVGAREAKPVPPAAATPSRRRAVTPLTPMRQAAAKSMRRLAGQVQDSHPDMTVHQHLRDAARTLESGNEEAAQRHLRAAMFALTPQSLMRNGIHTDDPHIAARLAMHGVHRHLLLVKDIADVAAKNQAAIRRDSYGDLESAPTLPHPPLHADPNAGYGPGALAQKPAARQPPGDQALNAPSRANSGGSDPAVADPVGPQPKGSKQFTTWDEAGHAVELACARWGWDELASVVELASRPKVVDLVGPKGYIHGWIFVGIPGPGQEVFHPHHGHGVVTGSEGGHVQVSFDAGHSASFSVRPQQGPGHFERMTDDKLATEFQHSQGSRSGAVIDELDRRDRRDQEQKAQRVRSLYAEHPKTETDRNRVYQSLVNEGENPEDAWAHAHSTDMETMQRQAATQQLRDQGFKGASFDALARDAFRQEIQRRVVAAEAATNGYMLSPKARRAGIDERSLFTGPESRARKHASPELKEWWDQNGRPTAADFKASLVGRAVSAGPTGGDFYASVTWDDLASVIDLSARTAQLEVTPAPYGKPGGPGLYGVKGLKHSDYLEQIVKALREKRGMSKGRATAIAYGALRKWSRGGGHAHPEVRAAAAGALAEEKAKGAAAKAAHGHAVSWDELARVVELAVVSGKASGWDGAAVPSWDDVAVELSTVIDLYNPAGNPNQPRVPPGQPGAGKFTQAQSQQQAKGKPAPKGKQPKGGKTAHQQHVAHVQHTARQARQKAALLGQARQDRAKAAGIMKQITALQKIIAGAQAATGKTVSASSNVTKTTAGSTTAASASTKAAAASTAASKAAGTAAGTASTTASTTAKATAASKRLGPLQQQYKSLMASAAKASAQAAKL